jgi:hypothetical protein
MGATNLTKLNATGALGTFAAGNGPNGVVYDGANIWVTDFNATTVVKLSKSTGATLGTFTVGSEPAGVAFDGANVWVTNFGSGNVNKL